MRLTSPQMNIMYKACMKAARPLIRDYGEIEKLQVSSKSPGDFVTSSDKRIEKMQNLKISEIFKTKGEAYFRELEFNVTLQSLDGDNNIISLGGGAFMNKELRKVLKQKSSTFWLHWNADTLIKRIKNNDKRPIIKGLDDAEIKKLINERNKIYYFSDFKIICESLKKTEIVDKIIQKCRKNEIIC